MRHVAEFRRAAWVMAPLLATLTLPVRSAVAQDRPTRGAIDSVRRSLSRGTFAGLRAGDLALYRPALLRLYGDSTARLLWTRDGYPTSQAHAVIADLVAAEERGLRPDDYDAGALARWVAELGSAAPGAERDAPAALLDHDAWLSLSLMRFLDHIHRGRVSARAFGFALPTKRADIEFASMAEVVSAAPDVHAVVNAVEPPYAGFVALERVLARYRTLAADGGLVAPAATRRAIRPGDAWEGVPALRQLLVAFGDLAPDARVPADTFAGALIGGVREFQRHHGLEPDGVLGPATMAELRVPLVRRVRQIELTLERWRWLPDDPPSRFTVVNIPGFRLYGFDRTIVERGPVMRMDVIVGRAYTGRRTPVFVDTMRYVIFHPYWDVPPSIARNEEIPRIRRDWSYAEREGLEIARGGDTDAIVYAMTPANLDRVAAGSLRLRQRPGPRNALGAVKFVFPNPYNVYLHDTPTASLFERARRDFSHGCIRVSDPAALAEFVLTGEDEWTRARIDSAMQSGVRLHRVVLQRPLPVYILYATVVADEHGVPYFYPDLYGHDAALDRAFAPTIALLAPAETAGSR